MIFITPSVSQERFIRGSYAVGGDIGFSKENDKYENFRQSKLSLALKPRISYFILDNISADLQLGFGHNDEEGEYYDEWFWEWHKYEKVNSDLSIGLGSSYYLPLENSYPFIRAVISYSSQFVNSINRKKEGETILNTSIGLAVFISQSVAIEPELGYDYVLWSDNGYKKDIYWLSFGIKYYVYEFGLD